MKTNPAHTLLFACGLALLALPSALAKDADKKLDKLDTDDNGQISRAEHTAGMQRLFSSLDADNDGAVTAAEADSKDNAPHNGATSPNDTKRNDMDRGETFGREKFKSLDKNSDGRVTLEEVATGCDATFDKMDTDHDGSLSKEELETSHKMKSETHN